MFHVVLADDGGEWGDREASALASALESAFFRSTLLPPSMKESLHVCLFHVGLLHDMWVYFTVGLLHHSAITHVHSMAIETAGGFSITRTWGCWDAASLGG